MPSISSTPGSLGRLAGDTRGLESLDAVDGVAGAGCDMISAVKTQRTARNNTLYRMKMVSITHKIQLRM